MDDASGNPRIWRRIRVSAGMKLNVFQDKVLSPIMGWCVHLLVNLVSKYWSAYITSVTKGEELALLLLLRPAGWVDFWSRGKNTRRNDAEAIRLNGHASIPKKSTAIDHMHIALVLTRCLVSPSCSKMS